MGRPKDMQAAQCQLCGQKFSRAGLVGHMRWKHARDHKAPMVPVERPMLVGEARRKAQLLDAMTPLKLEKVVIGLFDGRELKDTQGVVVGRFRVKKGAREATLVNLKGEYVGTLAAGKGEAEKALLELKQS